LERELGRVIDVIDIDTFEHKIASALLDKLQLRFILMNGNRKNAKQKVIL